VPLYYFKLVDSIIVADHGVHELVDDDAARVEAIKLARSLRETRPQLEAHTVRFQLRLRTALAFAW
jgi:hypothetical protein